jgi:dTDP-4-amino-4,6-dideoxygalactose transaminase
VPPTRGVTTCACAALGLDDGALPASEAACREVLSLPIHPELSAAAQETVAEAIRDYYAG